LILIFWKIVIKRLRLSPYSKVYPSFKIIYLMSWFEEWFDSPLYEKLYANRNEEEAALLAELIASEIPLEDYPVILDLGCGRGRHSLELARRGYRVTGIDLSENAIEKAQKKAAGQKLANIDFMVRDMRQPLLQTFDAIVNLFTTFGYFLEDDENSKVLQGVSMMLKPNGLFMLDYLNREAVERNLVPEESGTYGGVHYRITRSIDDQMVFKSIRFSGGELKEPMEYQERVKLYDREWFEVHLKQAGMQMVKCYGDYRGKPFSSKSDRLLMISKKV
jgi:2-polyprenyl-3-methyl-5-hydroxy-6-metoxy-1,4-benzoquinol methylase